MAKVSSVYTLSIHILVIIPIPIPLRCPYPFQVRVEAMHHLLQFPMADLVAMETWPQLRPAFSDTLMDCDAALAVSL